MAKNEFKKTYEQKKVDANGNVLSIEIGKGNDLDMVLKVSRERTSETDIRFRCNKGLKSSFKASCEKFRIDNPKKDKITDSEVSRQLHIAFCNGTILFV